MPRIEEQIEVSLSRADVFKFCHDLDHRSEWDEQVDKVELLTPRPMRQGTLLRIDAKQGGSVVTWDAEYVVYQFPGASKMRVLDAAPSSHFGRGSELSWEFESVGSGTRVTWLWNYTPNGILATIFDVLLARRLSTRQSVKRTLANLKQAIESGSRAGWQS